MKLVQFLLLNLLLSLPWIIDGQLTRNGLNDLLDFDCNQLSVTLHIFSAQLNPVWTVNIEQIVKIKSVARNILKDYDKNISLVKPTTTTTRIMGYHGFTISCSTDNEIFVHGIIPLENQLLESGRSFLSPTIIRHVSEYIGQSISLTNYTSLTRINCDHVPIKGSDKVPTYSPQTENGGCFVKKYSKNNCYAYGNRIKK
jgi:hypothetical protein